MRKLNSRLEKEPENIIAKWNLAKFNGNNAEAESLLPKIENGGSLFNPKSKDTGLALIIAILELND